jgi:hypothetical protein
MVPEIYMCKWLQMWLQGTEHSSELAQVSALALRTMGEQLPLSGHQFPSCTMSCLDLLTSDSVFLWRGGWRQMLSYRQMHRLPLST